MTFPSQCVREFIWAVSLSIEKELCSVSERRKGRRVKGLRGKPAQAETAGWLGCK